MVHTASLPRETRRDWINDLRQDIKFRYVPFRGYYRVRAYKYMWRKNPEMGLLRFLVDPKRDSLDIGANLGLFTYFLARYSRHVHAFEPNPYPLRTLRSIIDSNVTLREMAVGDKTGEAELVVPKGRKGWSSNGARLGREVEGPAARVTVRCSRIDDLGLSNIGFVKIDVEGFEYAVLDGAREMLARDRPRLFLENEYSHIGDSSADVFKLLDELDYDGFALIDGLLTSLRHFSFEEHQVKRVNNEQTYVKNFVFLPR